MPPGTPKQERLLRDGKRALWVGLNQVKTGRPLADIGNSIGAFARKNRYTLITNLGTGKQQLVEIAKALHRLDKTGETGYLGRWRSREHLDYDVVVQRSGAPLSRSAGKPPLRVPPAAPVQGPHAGWRPGRWSGRAVSDPAVAGRSHP